ncbi:MAG TPA: glucokinase [Burkholderiales bacterium]|nr:glucokinase [Burkholderiales bacterium]
MLNRYPNAAPKKTLGGSKTTSRARRSHRASLRTPSRGRNLILAGDVGGTKTLLELGELQDGRWVTLFGVRYLGSRYPDFFGVLKKFFSDWTAQRRSSQRIAGACFGVAGPVFDNRVRMTNLPWSIDGDLIAEHFGIARVKVVNDFAAAAAGIELLQPADLVTLQSGEPVAGAPRVVIGPGTGLGVAYLVRTAKRYLVVAGEGGHAGFAPAMPEAFDLFRDLYSRQGRVSSEHVVSGPGLVRIYEFVCRSENKPPVVSAALSSDESAAAITRAALDLGDPMCLHALDLFIACFGALAGDHALSVMARGGVYIAGGIAPKILPRLSEGRFCTAFNAKGGYSAVVAKIPVHVVTNAKLGLLGAALLAIE